jgi:hypothetical protein
MIKQFCIILISLFPFQGLLLEKNNSEIATHPAIGLFTQSQDRQIFENQFVPDSTINNFKLCTKTGLFRDTYNFLDSLNGGDGPDWFILLVSNQNQVFKLWFYPGGYADEFSYFEVYQGSNPDLEGLKFKRIKSDHFITESGIRLGISKEELFEIKGNNYSNEHSTENEIIYSFDSDSELHDFLMRKNEAGYIAKYKFVENELVEFGFGYIYP